MEMEQKLGEKMTQKEVRMSETLSEKLVDKSPDVSGLIDARGRGRRLVIPECNTTGSNQSPKLYFRCGGK